MDRQSGNGILEDFRIEFWDCWQQLPNKTFFFILLIAWLALFHFLGNSTLGYFPTRSLLHWMYISYNPIIPESEKGGEHPADAGDAHGNFVPFVVLVLLWWKRKDLLNGPVRSWWPGLFLVAAGLALHVVGYGVQQARISIVGLFIGIYGLMGLAWGPAWLKKSFFPFCLFIFCVPLGSLAEPITFRLRLLVSQLVEQISQNILQIDVLRQGTMLSDPTGKYHYEVAAACSGIRSLIATIGLAVVLGFLSFTVWWKRLVMIASAFPLAVLGNTLRMLTIVIAAEIGGPDWGKWVHDSTLFGLLPYVPAFIGLLVLENYLRPAPPAERNLGKAVSAEAGAPLPASPGQPVGNK